MRWLRRATKRVLLLVVWMVLGTVAGRGTGRRQSYWRRKATPTRSRSAI